VPVKELFRALVFGLALSDVLPFRLGEIARVFLVARHGVPVGTSLAAILVERVLDGIALTALLAVGIVLSGAEGWMRDVAVASAALFAVVTILLLGAGAMPGVARRVGHRVLAFAPKSLHDPLERALDTGLAGLSAMAHPVVGLQLVGLSLLAWTFEASMYRLIMEGFRIPQGWGASMMGAGAANLATLVPAAPGYVGTFDAALKQVLVDVFFAPVDEAVAFTIVVHVVLIVPVVLLGVFFMWQEDIKLSEIIHRSPSAPSADAATDAAGQTEPSVRSDRNDGSSGPGASGGPVAAGSGRLL
jgi:glycosyltransferase 2 family protein